MLLDFYKQMLTRCKVDLPISTDAKIMQQYWQERNKEMKPGTQPLPEALLKSSEGNTVAWLAYLIEEFPFDSPPADPYEFVRRVVFDKLVQEVCLRLVPTK